MQFLIPIIVEERPGREAGAVFKARPVFHLKPVCQAERLGRVVDKLTNELRRLLEELGRMPRHDSLVEWATIPECETKEITIRLEVADESKLRPYFVVTYEALGRKLCFVHTLPHVQFELRPGQDLSERTTTVLTRYFRELEKNGDAIYLDDYAVRGHVNLMTVEIDITPASVAKDPVRNPFAALFGEGNKKDGETELRKTARSLNALYPDGLDRAFGRDAEVEELANLIAGADRRPILLVGPRRAGKTAIVHELTWRLRSSEDEWNGRRREMWLVSPMRLISGMSVLGEWESRLTAILEYAGARDHFLYFDDLLGLFSAGRSSASDLNVAQVLRPYLEQRKVRIIAEITPESWRVLRERDRTLADLFHLITVPEPTEPETMRILIAVARQLETRHGCQIPLPLLPMVYDLHQRLVRDAAFPGKAIGFLHRLAVRYGGQEVSQSDIIGEVSEKTGLQRDFLDPQKQVTRPDMIHALTERLIGQETALEAFADVLMTLKAQLNDPRRPLATFLLPGPTGVGKTQAAKALAEVVFGNSDRLLRFDMNEYLDGRALAKLCGTASQPDGLLTSAVRRQPFSVILLDEIEKASSEVFDMLLAVLDEGRLTDALGRVADFSYCIILMTSNLGARESASKLGFEGALSSKTDSNQTFLSAVEKFFRPEFFNRIDRIIPFTQLQPAQLELIARNAIENILARDGMNRRACLLHVETSALRRLVEMGYQPQLGARALKRVVEREIAQPLAEKLAAVPARTPMVAAVSAYDGGFVLDFNELHPVAPSVDWPGKVQLKERGGIDKVWRLKVMDGIAAFLDRLDAELGARAPHGTIDLNNLSPESAHYFLCREHFAKVEGLWEAFDSAVRTPAKVVSVAHTPKKCGANLKRRGGKTPTSPSGKVEELNIWRTELGELAAGGGTIPATSPLMELLGEIAYLNLFSTQPLDDRPALVVFRTLSLLDAIYCGDILEAWCACLGRLPGGSSSNVRPSNADGTDASSNRQWGVETQFLSAFFAEGFQLRRLLPTSGGMVASIRDGQSLGVIAVEIYDAHSLEEAKRLVSILYMAKDQAGPNPSANYFRGPLVMTEESYGCIDFRSGLILRDKGDSAEIGRAVRCALPLPPEVEI